MKAEVRAFEKVLPQQAVGILVASALPRALWIAEVDIQSGFDAKSGGLRHLWPLIPARFPLSTSAFLTHSLRV